MSVTPEKRISFGRYLQRCRKERGISAEDLAAELKITTHLLSAIENEDFSRLPGVVYTRGFLRVYAGVVGADAAWVLNDYLKTLSAMNAMQEADEAYRREGAFFWRRLGITGAVLLLVMSVPVLMNVNWKDRTAPPPDRHQSQTSSPAVEPSAAGVDSDNRLRATLFQPDMKREDNIRLSVITIEETWVKIIIDNKSTREYTLQPGDRLELEAVIGYNLLIGNATGLRLSANRIPIDVPGRRGEVVNIEIP